MSRDEVLRLRIRRARAAAVGRAARSPRRGARHLFAIAARIADDRLSARLPAEELTDVLANVSRLLCVANWVENWEPRQ